MKKITMLILLMVCGVSFGQQPMIKTNGTNNPIHYNQQQKILAVAPSNVSVSPSDANVKNNGENNPVVYKKPQAVQQPQNEFKYTGSSATDLGINNPQPKKQNVTSTVPQGLFFNSNVQEEILADEIYRASLPSISNAPVIVANRNPQANIIPTAGATETFNPAVGDHFFDPGGPGGSSTGGTPGNYPNCNCDTQTTLAGVSEIDFQFFSVFATFDYLRIYDGTDATGTLLFDNSSGGPNAGDITLADMIASNGSSTFTSASGNFFFFFHATAVVDYGGWDVEIISASGGGGACGNPVLEINQDVEDVCMANISQTGLAQSYIPIEVEAAGAGIKFTDPSSGLNVDLSLWDALPNAGGTMLASGTTQTDGTDWADVYWDPVVNVTPGTTYYIVIDGDVALPCVAGSVNNPYPDGNVYANAGYNPFPNFDYTFRTYSCDGGGGGGLCSEENPNDFTFENGFNCSSASAFMTANDVTVAADENFTLNNITASIFANGGISNVDVNYYADAAGLPGALIGSEASVTIDNQTVIGSNFGFDVNEVEMTVTPFVFNGQSGVPTTYWIELSVTDGGATGSVFWVVTSSTAIGNPTAQFNAGWSIPDPLMDGVYIWEGNCEPIGGGVVCSEENPNDFTFENGFNCSSASAFMTANDVTVAADENFTLNNITASIFANGGISNVDVNYYADAAGLPGALIGSEASVTIDNQTVIGSNFGFDVNEVEMTVTPFVFNGQAGVPTTYWIELSVTDGGATGSVFWVVTSSTAIGNPTAQFNAGWGIPDPLMDGVYIWEGNCEPIGGGGNYDDCSGAIALACGDSVVGETLTATDSGGNPAPDVFYKFTGSGSPQLVTISLCGGGTDYDSLLRVFDDCDLQNELASNDDFCGLQSELTFTSDGTSTYYIMVEGFSSSSGNFTLDITCEEPLANDDCSGAIAVSCGDSITGTTDGATIDSGVAPDCGTSVTSPGVWYSLNDNSGLAGTITLSLCNGTDYDSKISVYTGDCNAPPLTCVGGNDDSCGLQSEITFNSDGNTTFLILVHGFGGATGNFTLDVTCTPTPPPNDMIANSIDVDEIGFPYTDPAVAMPAATTENGNPVGCDLTGANGVWYNFVSEGDGTANAMIVTPGGASSVTFYTAPDENAVETDLTLVPQQSNQCGPGTSASIFTLAGQAYYVFVLNSGAITDIVIDGTNLGVSDNAITGFSYYPNPTIGVLNLKSVDNIEQVSLYNLLGQRVVDSKIGATEFTLDISGLSTGTYLMKVTVNGQIGTYKVLKQ